jgi:hypothetical protein
MDKEKIREEMGYLEVGDGWLDIVWDCHQAIKALNPDYKILQIKEKFGGLRYYCEGDVIGDTGAIIDEAEARAAVTCEHCGADGKMSEINNWLSTLCRDCFDQRCEGRKGTFDLYSERDEVNNA